MIEEPDGILGLGGVGESVTMFICIIPVASLQAGLAELMSLFLPGTAGTFASSEGSVFSSTGFALLVSERFGCFGPWVIGRGVAL